MKQEDLEKLEKNIELIETTIEHVKSDPSFDKNKLNELLSTKNKLASAKKEMVSMDNDTGLYNEYKSIIKTKEGLDDSFYAQEITQTDYRIENDFLDSRMRLLSKNVDNEKFNLFEERYQREREAVSLDINNDIFDEMVKNEFVAKKVKHEIKEETLIEKEADAAPQKHESEYEKQKKDYSPNYKPSVEDGNDYDLKVSSDDNYSLLSEYDIYDLYSKVNIKEIVPGDMQRVIHLNDDSIITEKPDNINFAFDKRNVDPLTAASRVIGMAKQKEWETLTLNSSNPAVLSTAYEMAVKEGLEVQPLNKEQEAIFKSIHAQKRLDQYAPFNGLDGKQATISKDASLEAHEYKPSKMRI